MSNEQTAPVCQECAKLRKILEEVTTERNNLRRIVTGKAPRENDLAGFKERLMGMEMHMKGLTVHMTQIFDRLQTLEALADPWKDKTPVPYTPTQVVASGSPYVDTP